MNATVLTIYQTVDVALLPIRSEPSRPEINSILFLYLEDRSLIKATANGNGSLKEDPREKKGCNHSR